MTTSSPEAHGNEMTASHATVGDPGVRGESVYADEKDEIRVLDLMTVLFRRWRLVLAVPMAAAVVMAAISLLLPPTYTANTAFAPQAPSSSRGQVPASLAGFAGQLGISLGPQANQSPEFYVAVLKSRELLDRLLLRQFSGANSGRNSSDSAPLYSLLDPRGDDLADSLYRARRKLERQIRVDVEYPTGIVRLSVDSRSPKLAADLANAFIDHLNEFNSQTRQSQARELRRFLEARLASADSELRRSEENLKNLYERNRSWQHSPQLVVEEDRLRRQVQIRQEVYLTLNREYETARIDEVNNTPVITIIDSAVPPRKKSKPRRAALVGFAFVLGAMLAVLCAFGVEYGAHARRKVGT